MTKPTIRKLSFLSLLAVLALASVSIKNWQITSAPEYSPGPVPVRWEHGWKTDRVIATRYVTVNHKGYNLGFRFPKNPYHGNSAEVFELYQRHGGFCWHAGDEQLVSFEGVHDTESADRKLQEILP